MELQLTAAGCQFTQLPYGIILCYLTPVNTPRLNPSLYRPVFDLPTLEGWKAELT